MQRKLIELGNGTLVVSLPSKFVKEHGLKKGENLSYLVNKDRIQFYSIASIKEQPLILQAKYNTRTLRSFLTSAYRKGIKKIKIHLQNKQDLETIQKTLSLQTIGMEVISSNNGVIEILDFSSSDILDIKQIIAKLHDLSMSMINSLIDSIESGDKFDNVGHIDREINKFSNYCIRVITSDSSFSNYEKSLLFHLIRSIEEISDEYHYFAQKIRGNDSLNVKEYLSNIQQSKISYNQFFELFHSFSDSKCEQLFKDTKKQLIELETLGLNNQDHYIYTAVSRIRKAISTLIEFHLGRIPDDNPHDLTIDQ